MASGTGFPRVFPKLQTRLRLAKRQTRFPFRIRAYQDSSYIPIRLLGIVEEGAAIRRKAPVRFASMERRLSGTEPQGIRTDQSLSLP